jgi:hypothetical protein
LEDADAVNAGLAWRRMCLTQINNKFYVEQKCANLPTMIAAVDFM